MGEQDFIEEICEFSLVLSFHSRDDLFRFAEKMKHDNGSGISRIECIDKRVMAKVIRAIEKKKMKKNKGISLKLKEEASNDPEHELCG